MSLYNSRKGVFPVRLIKSELEHYAKHLTQSFDIKYLSGKNEQNLHLHYHDFCELIFIVKGSVSYQTSSGIFALRSGDVILLSAYEKHGPQVLDNSTLYERITLQVEQETLEALSRGGIDLSVCFKKKKFSFFRFPYYTQSQIRMTLGKLLSLRQDQPFGCDVLGDVYLTELFVKISEFFYEEDSAAATAKLQPVQLLSVVEQYIVENIDSPISIDDIANYVCINKYSFMRFFRELSGCTAYQYIINRRLETAENLIRGGATFSDAAEKCGFSDYSCFYRCFTKKHKMSPQTYFGQS